MPIQEAKEESDISSSHEERITPYDRVESAGGIRIDVGKGGTTLADAFREKKRQLIEQKKDG